MNMTIKKAWEYYGKLFGRTIIHPQFIMRQYAYGGIRFAKKYASGDLVDIGCGIMPYREELLPIVASYTGVDHPKVSKLYKGTRKPDVLADVKDLPFKNGTFDTVLFLQVLEYVDEPQKAFSEITRILRKNGTLILSVPFLYPIHDAPYDQARYTSYFLKNVLKDHSMRIMVFKPDGGIVALVFQSVTLFILRLLKENVGERNILIIFLLIPALLLLPLWILFGNLLVAVLSFLPSSITSEYFALNYTVVAKKI